MMAYKIIKEKGCQFCCFACLQISQQDEIEQLKTEVARLSSLVSEVQSTPSQDVSSAGPTVPRSYASTVSTGESNTSKPTKTNTILKSNRKFNIVIYGIGECKQGAKWPERLASDLSKVGSVLTDIDGSLTSNSIKDCYHLRKYRADQEKPRPILVKFVRIEDVSKVLANRSAATPPIVVKPDMARDERLRESTLLKERWRLISSGVPKRAIKISRSKMYVHNVEYGTYSQSGFVHASTARSDLITPVTEHTKNLGPHDTSTSTTQPRSQSVPSLSPPLCDLSATVTGALPHSTLHCPSPTTVNNPSPDQHSTRASSPPRNHD